MDLSRMRKTYDKADLDQVAHRPLEQFQHWFAAAQAAGVEEPNAMTLATISRDAKPSTRVVLAKSVDESGIVFYTNYDSRKGHDIAANPHVALQFFWPLQQQVIRIEGSITKVSEAESDEYYAQRPLDSRIGAWASPQSQEISSRAVLVANAAKFAAKFALHPPRPEHWGGYRVTPEYWEFWQGRPSRLHDRICYRLDDGSWHQQRLAP